MGDPSGIGPEIVAAALGNARVKRSLVPVVFGDASLARRLPALSRAQASVRGGFQGPTLVPVSQLPLLQRKPGKPTRSGGRAQFAYVEAAIAAGKAGEVEAICTAPVSKEQISRAGIPFMGHTEVLAAAFGVEVMMLMAGPMLRVALATNHLAIKDVPGALTVPRLVRQLKLLSAALTPMLGRRPRLAVCGLNPHAGEGGLLGTEEVEVISPAVAAARKQGIDCQGPFAADGLFAQFGAKPFDAVLAMFHDQGLIAAKALDFEHTVNVTLGLPLPRTSPDHGVAYDIAGKRRANPTPMVEALLQAAALAGRRSS